MNLQRSISRLFELLFVLLILFGMTSSCTNLNENPPSDVTSNNFFKNNKQILSALGVAYSNLSGYGVPGNILNVNETTTDEMVIPQRGKDWYDGGEHIALYTHTWTYQNPKIGGAWSWLYSGVSSTNRLIYQFNQLESQGSVSKSEGTKYISELKVLRAFYYYWLLDDFGNVPIVTKFKGASKTPANSSNFQDGRTKVFNFVENQIKSNIQNLSRKNDQTTFARVNVWAAHFLLAKLYLNAKVYTGNAMWQKAAAQCDSIINSGKFSLASNYFSNFSDNTQNDPEMIWAIPYDQVHFQGNAWDMATLSYANQETYNLTAQPWNGYATVGDFYNSFQKNDIRRKKGFLHGFQYDSNGQILIDHNSFAGSPHGDSIYFDQNINELQPRAYRDAGARFNKYQPDKGATGNLSNDVPIARYADVLLMKAECLWRMNQAPSEALHLVNMVRERAGLSDYQTLSAYKLLMARGHELYVETWRRQDLIRFRGGLHYKINDNGKKVSQYKAGGNAFEDEWWAKPVDNQSFRNVFPIPQSQLQSNPNLHQNPGYQH